jgi:PTH1 family peptidyl-tRNA hydrolase
MYLIVGLGNIGKKYLKTRHNYGFLLIDNIINNFNFIYQGENFKSDYYIGSINNQKIIAIKPNTFMNLSGEAVREVANFYKILPQNIIVLHDDVDIALGNVKYKIAGGNSGHNGLKSIDQNIGVNYARIRLGIGRPTNLNFEIADYVLGNFSNDEIIIINDLMNKITKNFSIFFTNDVANNLYKILRNT